jgi:hypothetical protein
LEKGNLSEQKKFGGKKIKLANKFFNLAKTIFAFYKKSDKFVTILAVFMFQPLKKIFLTDKILDF